MRTRTAQGLTIALLVSLGAAQRPNIHESATTKTEQAVEASMRHAMVAPPRAGVHPFQVGTASWYGQDFDGKPTASGEPYNMFELTAAHPSLPLGTLVKVTNLRNRRAVVVRINDRGPVVDGRIIDVSYSAAKALNFQSRGVQRVRLDLMPTRKPAPAMALLQSPFE